MLKIAGFASGSGSNLAAIYENCKQGNIDGSLEIIICNRKKAGIYERAAEWGIDCLCLRPGDFGSLSDYLNELLSVFILREVNFAVLAGFLSLIPPPAIEYFGGQIINIHPALLPRFGGKGMYGMNVHKAVLSAGEKISGATVHQVNERYDEGLVIAHIPVPVLKEDTPELLAGRILKQEHRLLPSVVAAFSRGWIIIDNGISFEHHQLRSNYPDINWGAQSSIHSAEVV